MKFFSTFAAITLLMFSQVSLADTESEKAAAKLLDAVGMEKALSQSMEQMLEVQINNNPSLLPYRDVMRKFFNKYMSYESLKPDIVSTYADAFTAKELNQISQFYASDAGQKSIKLMPELMRKGAEIGAKRIKA